MSPLLESLNQPVLVATAAGVSATIVPALQDAILQETIPLPAVQLTNLLLYVLNYVAARQPGRIDGLRQDEIAGASKNRQEQVEPNKELIQTFLPQRGKSLVAPSGWAFIIWAPIFLGEMIFALATPYLSSTATIVRQASGGFMGAQVFQTLWAAAFRPKYARSNAIFFSGVLLAGIAASLNQAHRRYAELDLPVWQYLLCCFPMTLHFGWTTAAALVNWNGTIAAKFADQNPRFVACFGHVSVIVGAAIGVWVTLERHAPVYGFVIAWALTACSTGMRNREKPLFGSQLQSYLCAAGAAASAASGVVASATRWRRP